EPAGKRQPKNATRTRRRTVGATAVFWRAMVSVLPRLAPSVEVDADGDVVGRLFAGAHFLVDRDAAQAVGGLRREEQVVDADAVVALPGAGLVVPERIEAVLVGDGAQGVCEAEVEKGAELRARLRQEQRILLPGFRVFGVARLGDGVVVAGEDERLLHFEQLL